MKKYLLSCRRQIAIITLLSGAFLICSFTVKRAMEEFLKQIGLTEPQAQQRITQAFFNGHVNTYKLAEARKIPLSDHPAVVTAAIGFAKKYTKSAAFKQEYEQMRAGRKPNGPDAPQTPEEFKKQLIESAKQSVAQLEENLKTATGDLKKTVEELLVTAKQTLKDAQLPDNQMVKMYSENYPMLKQSWEQQVAERQKEWENKYPADVNAYLKKQLERFLKETESVDFKATTTTVGKSVKFVNTEYERKNNNWKLAYRMGESAVKTARAEISSWMKEL